MNENKKMKPFNLKQALENQATRPDQDPCVVTRDGTKVLWLSHCSKLETVIAYLEGFTSFKHFNEDGAVSVKGDHHLDLFMAPATRKVTVHLYYHAYEEQP